MFWNLTEVFLGHLVAATLIDLTSLYNSSISKRAVQRFRLLPVFLTSVLFGVAIWVKKGSSGETVSYFVCINVYRCQINNNDCGPDLKPEPSAMSSLIGF